MIKHKKSAHILLLLVMLIVSFSWALVPQKVSAQPTPSGSGKEICDNGKDDDVDKLVDAKDPECYVLLEPLPGITAVNTSQGLAPYIRIMFRLAIGIAGVIAVVVIIISGITTMTSEAPFTKSAAKGRILDALVGLLLLLGCVVILNTINPELLNVGLSLKPISHSIESDLEYTIPDPVVTPHNTTGACPYAMNTPHTQESVDFESSDPNVQKNLDALAGAVTALKAKVKEAGGTLSVSSAHRSLAYQKHFYEIKTVNSALKADNNPDCATLRTQIKNEIQMHGLGGCDDPGGCIVNPPYTPEKCGGNANQSAAPHVRGIGVDLKIVGITRATADGIAASNGINLHWQNIPKDQAHWNLITPPYKGCASS